MNTEIEPQETVSEQSVVTNEPSEHAKTNKSRYDALYSKKFIKILTEALKYAPTLDPQVKDYILTRFVNPDFEMADRNIFDINDEKVFDKRTKKNWYETIDILAAQDPKEVGEFLEEFFGTSNPDNYDKKGNMKGFRMPMIKAAPGSFSQKKYIGF